MEVLLCLVELPSHAVNHKLAFLECRQVARLFLVLSKCLLRLAFSLELLFVDVILQALGLELELVVFRADYATLGALFFNLFGMLDNEIVLLHLGGVSFLADLSHLSTNLDEASFGLIELTTKGTDTLLVT